MKKKRILLIGSSGMVGAHILQTMSPEYKITAPTRQEMDLSSENEIEKYLHNRNFDAIIHAAGVTSQEFAEKNKEYAMQINCLSLNPILQYAKNFNIPLIYFSTDAVFDGIKSNRPYVEDDHIKPVNHYGYTKAKGEELVLGSNSINTVLRLVSVYTENYTKKIDFVRRANSQMRSGAICFGITDSYFNPTFTDDVVSALRVVLHKSIGGVIHLGSVDTISNYDFIDLLRTINGYSSNLIKPVSFESIFEKSLVKRGQYCWLDTTKAQKILGEVLHTNLWNLELLSAKSR